MTVWSRPCAIPGCEGDGTVELAIDWICTDCEAECERNEADGVAAEDCRICEVIA